MFAATYLGELLGNVAGGTASSPDRVSREPNEDDQNQYEMNA
jgi:hypothetical protein